MKNWSIHFYFEENFDWKNLETPFTDIFNLVKGDKKLIPEDEQQVMVKYELNLREMRNGKKPLGFFSDQTDLSLLFPIDRKEMILNKFSASESIHEYGDKISKILKAAKIKFKIDYDKMLLIELIKSRK